ncbi:hypothetical protein M427DRAFT_63266 [Gonapodya prolifera JEL478]|uniref:GOLD domain-containing protein n=1 Tax=Gonapodya prolifera (strain JEL478) TaxID=1344416 RepID=A0A139A0L9_GONPJ|nr:hypothetical protein M427DRAFT_63266 [Gonapodya prolifera JEL478]|eukprot:KXS09903.1 hypothetical protein M427DRAFT_63266 [Gonapodya prolifera JEL478]
MQTPLLLLLLLLLSSPTSAFVYTTNLPGHDKLCLYEDLKQEQHLDLTFMVDSSDGEFEIDFWVMAPGNRITFNNLRQATGSHQVVAEQDGRYAYCFSNYNYPSAKKLTFSHYGPDERDNNQRKFRASVGDEISEEAKKVDQEIMSLAENLRMVRDEQTYMMAREARHRESDTAESTNGRVVIWSLAETALLITVCVWQVWYLRSFFEVKRVV